MGRLIEGFWDCNSCGKTGIRGSIKACPDCGKPRDKDTKFYLDPTKSRYVPKNKSAQINRNPDWVCEYCNGLNSDNDTYCSSCGSPRTSENLNYFEHHAKQESNTRTYQQEANRVSSGVKAENESVSQAQSYTSNDTYEEYHSTLNHTSNVFSNITRIALITLIPILLIAGLIYLFIPKEQELTIQSFSWKRNIEIERFQTVNESGWSVPSGGRVLYSNWEFYAYQDVLDHYETRTREVAKERLVGYEEYVTGYRDLGNGYFEEITSEIPVYETYYETEYYEEPVYRSEPIYQIKYYYEIDKWLYERSVNTYGNDKNPYWGEANLYSNERISNKLERYTVLGVDKKEKTHEFDLSYDDWNSLNIGQTAKFEVSFGKGKIVQ